MSNGYWSTGSNQKTRNFFSTSSNPNQNTSNSKYTITYDCKYKGYTVSKPHNFDKLLQYELDKQAVAIASAACIDLWGESVDFQEVVSISNDRKRIIIACYSESRRVPAEVTRRLESALDFLKASVYTDGNIKSSKVNSLKEPYTNPLMISIDRLSYEQEKKDLEEQIKQQQYQQTLSRYNMTSNSNKPYDRPTMYSPPQHNKISLLQKYNREYDSESTHSKFEHNKSRDRGISKRRRTKSKRHITSDRFKNPHDKRGFFRKVIDSVLGVNFDEVTTKTLKQQSN